LKIAFQINEEEYFEYSYYTAWKAPWNKKKRFKYYFRSTIVGCAFIALLIFLNKSETPGIQLVSVLFFLVIIVPLLIIMSKERFRKAARKNYNDPGNKNLFAGLELSFDESGIISKDEFSESQSKWSAFVKRHTTQNLYILYQSDLAGLVIPKRAFKNETERQEFEKMLAQFIPLQAEPAATNQ
jgi:hypothetical protein